MTTENIWTEFNRQLYKFILTRVKDADTANDILQEVFLKIHLKRATLSDKDKLVSWVYQITRNAIIDQFRKAKPIGVIEENPGEITTPVIFNEEFSNCIKPFVNQMHPVYRDALLQTDLGMLSQKEFAANQNISYSGAKSRIQRGRQQLLELFDQCCQFRKDKYGNVLSYQAKIECGNCE